MSETETHPETLPETLPENLPETQTEVDPIESIYEGQCPSISGRSTLTFAIGRHPVGALHLRIVGNSGGGMFCEDWASGQAIDEVIVGATALTSRSFDVLHPGRSINTAGFILATLKHLGLIRASAKNSRHQEHVPTETFDKVAIAAIDPGASIKKTKAPKAKPKDAA